MSSKRVGKELKKDHVKKTKVINKEKKEVKVIPDEGKKEEVIPDEEKEEVKVIPDEEKKNKEIILASPHEKKKEKCSVPHKRTRLQTITRIRMDTRLLKMTARMVDSKMSDQSAKVQCENDLFGHASFTYISKEDFEAVFRLGELTGSAITCYMMYLYEEIKNGGREDHGICFVSPTDVSLDGRKDKFVNGDDASRSIANRLSTRKENQIVLIPFNPGLDFLFDLVTKLMSWLFYFAVYGLMQVRTLL